MVRVVVVLFAVAMLLVDLHTVAVCKSLELN